MIITKKILNAVESAKNALNDKITDLVSCDEYKTNEGKIKSIFDNGIEDMRQDKALLEDWLIRAQKELDQ
jgi:hypothetical protein